jgi:CRISPR system Cascade subunit CasE
VGFLFRLDPLPATCPSRHAIVVQSAIEPDWEYAFHNAPEFLAAKPKVQPFNPSFAPGQRLRFRLRANPTKKVGTASKVNRLAGQKDPGQRLALLREEDQLAWLLAKGAAGGFRIPGAWRETASGQRVPNFRVETAPEGWVRCGKDGHRDGRFLAVRFDGLLEVDDPERFQQTVAAGIGSAKGFGFGLLSLAPARQETYAQLA